MEIISNYKEDFSSLVSLKFAHSCWKIPSVDWLPFGLFYLLILNESNQGAASTKRSKIAVNEFSEQLLWIRDVLAGNFVNTCPFRASDPLPVMKPTRIYRWHRDCSKTYVICFDNTALHYFIFLCSSVRIYFASRIIYSHIVDINI